MATQPSSLDSVLESPTPLHNQNATDASYLNPSSTNAKRLRIASDDRDDDDDDDISGDFGNNDIKFNASYSELRQMKSFENKTELIMSYLAIAIEGDLAGFQFAWIAMSTGFLVLKIFDITDVIRTIEWWAIFVIPFFNAILTAWFDYIIRKYRSTNTVESLRKARFVVLWAVKVVFAIYVTTYWMWGRGSFMARFRDNEDYQVYEQACDGQSDTIYVCVLAAVFMGEVMITTVLINSEQNLSVSRTPTTYRVVLLLIRPFVWVYNRTMVMFLCFYAIYGLFYSIFVVGFLCDMYCESFYSKENQKVGLQMLLVPFTHPSYLMNIDQIFASWDNTPDDKFLDTFVIVFLCQSFYVDCLNSLWQFSRRYLKPQKDLDLEASKSIRGLPNMSQRGYMAELAKELPISPASSLPGNMARNMSLEQQIAASPNDKSVALK